MLLKSTGRGTKLSIDPRYLETTRVSIDDGWQGEKDHENVVTTVTVEKPRSILNRNHSPDVPFEQSINPYRGCEHGCIYCYARPTHAYLDLSPGLDFESKLFVKPDAAILLRKELGKPSYRCKPIAMGTNTDPYQPVERKWQITRQIIEVLRECHHPLSMVTKSSLIERDIDLLTPMAEQGLVQIYLSITTLDNHLAKRMEPRAAAPFRRLQTLARLNQAGIPAGGLFAPVIPCLNDTEMEAVLQAAAEAGAESAGYVMLRLPHEIKQLFKEWLELHEPLKSNHVMNMVRDIRQGKENDPNFYTRMSGRGVYADMIKKRFMRSCKKLGLNKRKFYLVTDQFMPPVSANQQMQLF